MNSGYGAIYWLQSFLVTYCETVPQNEALLLGDSATNWGIVTKRQCLKLGHSH